MVEFNGDVQLVIYDLMGRRIKTLVNEYQMEGVSYSISWDGKNTKGVDVPSGIYFTRLISNNQLTTKKIGLMS
jgi:flagellar hook assembly protein FlgD